MNPCRPPARRTSSEPCGERRESSGGAPGTGNRGERRGNLGTERARSRQSRFCEGIARKREHPRCIRSPPGALPVLPVPLTGRVPRWKVLPRQMRQPSAASCAAVRPLAVPRVPTGMNTGHGTVPCGSRSSPARARLRPHSATTRRTGTGRAGPAVGAAILGARDRKVRRRLRRK